MIDEIVWPAAVDLPRPVALLLGAAFLFSLLAFIKLRHGQLLDPIRQRSIYRLLLAAVAGWFSAWFLLPFSFLPVPESRGFFVPGMLFGALVILPALESPQKHPARAAIAVWVGAVGYAVIWFLGMVIVEVLDNLAPSFPSDPDEGSGVIDYLSAPVIIGVPPFLVFGAIIGLAACRLRGARLTRNGWISVLALSAICGTAYAGVVLSVWDAWIDAFERFTFDNAAIFLVHIAWYAVFATIIDLKGAESTPPMTRADKVYLSTLAVLTVLVVWSLGLENYPYEWFTS